MLTGHSLNVYRAKPVRTGRVCRFEHFEPRRMMAADALAADWASSGHVPAEAQSQAVVSAPLNAPTASLAGRVSLAEATQCNPVTDAGVEGAVLHLLDEQGQRIQSVETTSDGAYQFSNLAAGVYAVQQEQPAGLADRGMFVGNGGGQVLAANLLGEIPVAAGSSLTGYHFCEAIDVGSQTDGPPPLDPQGSLNSGSSGSGSSGSGSSASGPLGQETIAANNIFLRSPSLVHAAPASQGGFASLGGYVEQSISLKPQRLQQSELSLADQDSSDSLVRRSRAVASESVREPISELKSAVSRVARAVFSEELFESVDWQQSVIDQLLWFAPRKRTSEQFEQPHQPHSPNAAESDDLAEVARIVQETALEQLAATTYWPASDLPEPVAQGASSDAEVAAAPAKTIER